MKQSRLSQLIVVLCSLLLGFTLLTNIPDADNINRYGGQAVLWVALTAFTLVFGVLLSEGEFSAAHIYGIAVFLSSAPTAEPLILWVAAIGALVGGSLLLLRRQDQVLRRRLTLHTTRSVIMICARLTFSLLAAGRVYDALGGKRPLTPPLGVEFVPLMAFAGLYALLYALIFLLEKYVERHAIRRFLQDNWLLLAAMLVIPIPFGVLAAVVISQTPSSILVFSIGAVLATLGLYRFSRTNYQYRKQLDEQRSLMAVSQALQSDLKLDSLLYAIYNQVAQLLHTDQFVTALYDRNSNRLRFPLVMRNGQPVRDYWEDAANSPLGRVLAHQLPVLVQQDGNGLTNWHSWLGVPLLAGGRLLGAITIRSDDPLQPFTDDDKRLLNVVAASAGVAIDNAQLYEHQAAQATRMEALSRTLPLLSGTLALDAVQQTIIAAASDMLQSDGVALYMQADDAMLPMQLVASTGLRQANETFSPDEIVKREGKANYWGLDLVVGNERVGGLAFFFNEGNAYREEDMPIALTFAAQAAQAIHNARQYTITDQALEQQIKQVTETRDRLQVILDTMREGIVLIDREGHVALANPRVELVGLKAADLVGHTVEALLEVPHVNLAERMGFESDQRVHNLVKALRASEHFPVSEPVAYTLTVDGDERYIERSIIPVASAAHDMRGALLVFSDETEAHDLMQMRADLSNMIVHDLRSPLTAVTTGLKLLRDIVPQENALRPTVVSVTETSQRAIRKMLVRVDSLLDISRLDSGFMTLETEPTDLATLADSVCIELSPLAQELEVTLTTDIHDETPALDADSDKIERVLQNLVDNALKFCPAGGHVTIRSHLPQPDAGNRFVRIDVADSGPGVPDEYKHRLFDRYVQIKGRRGTRRGSGLGLTFCRMVVEAHGGKIWIEDNPGGGSVFAFTLPAADAEEDSPATPVTS